MVNGWKKKGKYLYEHSITKWWIGIKKKQIDYYKEGWVLTVKRPNGDIEYGVTARTQTDIFKKATSYMRKHPSKAYQSNIKRGYA